MSPAETLSAVNALDQQRAEKRLKNENQILRDRLNASESEVAAWQSRFDAIEALGTATPRPYQRPAKGSKSSTAALLILTDWHLEESIDPRTCNGLNEFNLDIAARRIRSAFTNGLKLIDAWRKTWRVDELYVPLLGDMIAGYIHEELQESNNLSPTEALLQVEQHIWDGFAYLMKEGGFKRIIVPTCFGNHGRTTAKRRIKTGWKNSYEWLLYSMLAQHMGRKDRRVEWRVEKGYHNWQEIQGCDVRFHHGDNIKYQGGVGGISIPVNKAIAAWNRSKAAHIDYFGHWHQYIDQWNWTSCGCLCGYNDFSVAIKAEYQPPTQTLSLITRGRGKVATMPVYLDT